MKVVPYEVMASAYKKFVVPNNLSSVRSANKGDKGKGKIQMRMPDRQHVIGKWVNLYRAPE
jgi:hypothetical protein